MITCASGEDAEHRAVCLQSTNIRFAAAGQRCRCRHRMPPRPSSKGPTTRPWLGRHLLASPGACISPISVSRITWTPPRGGRRLRCHPAPRQPQRRHPADPAPPGRAADARQTRPTPTPAGRGPTGRGYGRDKYCRLGRNLGVKPLIGAAVPRTAAAWGLCSKRARRSARVRLRAHGNHP
jgi:hypothetical protein